MEMDSGQLGREPDALWLKQIAAGNRDAFEQLYGEYQKRLFRYFLRLVSRAEVAEELTNDVLVEVWKKAGEFRGLSKVSTWIFGIAHYKAMNQYRGKKPPTLDIAAASNEADPSATPEEKAAQVNLKEKIKRALQALSPEHREVMELTFTNGLSYQEISEIMQCPVNTVKTRMFYAKKQLQEVLQKMGIRRDTT
jgi:RNA polymerase sigma-70 factor (ECF subfamily)